MCISLSLLQTVQTTWRPQLPLPKELQLTDERHDDEHNTKANHNNSLTTTTTTTTAARNHTDYPLEEEDMERLRSHHPHHQHSLSGSAQQLTGKQKWSFGRLFRKKKDEELGAECSASSSEEDRKAGFVPSQRQSASKPKAKGKSARGSNKSLGFDHIVPQGAAPQPPPPPKPQHVDNEFFLPVEMVPPEPYYQNQPAYYSRSSNSLDRRLYLTPQQQQQQMMLQPPAPPHKSRSAQRGSRVNAGQPHSSEEELISLNSSTFSKYRSDESIHSGGQALHGGAPGQSRRSRAARNERYYKRLSRDGEVSHGGVPVQLQQQQQQPLPHRYKTQPVPLSIYQAPPAASSNSAYVQWQPQSASRPLQNSMQSEGGSKRSISYDSQIHLQNISGRQQSKPLPPPPPPRDPLRRVQQAGGSQGSHIGSSSGDLRPVSYAFDQSGRCVSDDRIWQPPHYQSVHSLNSQPGGSGSIASAPTQAQAQAHRRFITRAERNALPGKKSLPNGIDFHYVADATPRSRKPIHMIEGADAATPPSSGMLRTSKSGLANSIDSWQQQAQQTPSARSQQAQPLAKPRSISSSRLSELRAYPMPMYSEVQKPKRAAPQLPPNPAENVVCGSLHIKPGEHESQNYVEIRHRDVHKTNSMPHHYQRRSGEDLPNKYEEYVAEKREQHQQAPAPRFTERKASAPAIAPLYFPRKKPANLEEAINELEAIYKSLGLTEPPEVKEETKWEPKLEPKLNTKRETQQEPRQDFRQESRQESRQAPRQVPRQESKQESRQEFRASAKPEPKPRMPTPSDFEKFALAHADDYDDEDSPAGEPDPVRDDVAYRNLQLSNLQHRSTEKQPPFGIPVGPIVPAPQSDYLHVEPQTVRAPLAKQQKKSGSPDIVKDDLAVRALRKDPPGPKSSFIYPMQKKQRATRTQSANIYNLIQRDAAKPSGGDLSSYMELTRSIERAGSMSNLGGTEGSDATASDIPATLDLLRKLKAQDEELQLKKPATHHIPFRHPSQGGAIAQLPQHLGQDELKATPVPAPRKSLTPEPLLEDALNKIAQDAQASSIKLSQELHELRKEALITAARPKLNAEQQKLEQELQQIEAVSEAAKRCGQMLLETLPDQDEAPQQGQAEGHAPNPRKLHKEGKLIRAIDEVSEAANAVCEKILKDIVTTEPPVVVHEALQVKQQQEPPLVMPHLIKKLDPIQSDKIEAIAVRCMRQLSELASEATPTSEDHDYDNLTGCNNNNDMMSNGAAPTAAAGTDATLICPIAEGTSRGSKGSKTRAQSKSQALDEIDAIMQECERQAKQQHQHQTILISSSSTDDQRTTAPSMSSGSVSAGGGAGRGGGAATTTASSFSSSSDCLAKSSSPSNASRPMSSSITSFNPYSSSDYIKSQSSDYHAPSTDPIKTFSTTSYDVQSTPNNTTSNLTLSTPTSTSNNTSNTSNSTSTHHNQIASESSILSSVPKSPSTSPPLQLTPVSERRHRSSSSPSQYNSSEELAAIFGIEEQPKQRRKQQQPQLSTASTGNQGSPSSNANPCSTNTRYCAPVIVVVATSTNEPDQSSPDCDAAYNANATATPTNDSARSSSNCSSHNSSKLATIPETETEQELEQEEQPQAEMETELKLSPNFNRIYASKVNIVVDRSLEPSAEQTQFDSLSSLGEETSSNPDSGNASLADFPLIGGGNGVGSQANASLELHTAYNSRFEVREHYVSEVSISASEEDEIDGVSRSEHEFPPLPTEEELLESLREERELNEIGESVEETLKAELQVEEPVTESTEDTKADKKLNEELDEDSKLDEALKLDESLKEPTERLLEEIKPNQELNEELDEALQLDEAVEEPAKRLLTEINEQLDEDSALDEALKLDETATLSDAVYDLASECLKIEEERKEIKLDEDKHDEAELDEDELAYNQLVELALDEALLEETLFEDESIINELNESELDECDGPAQENELKRRKSIVYETPQINLSISEVRLNYETKVEQEATTTATATTTLDEAKHDEDIDDDNVDDMPIRDTLARNESSKGGENDIDMKGFPAERERDNKKDEDKKDEQEEEEKPTTSTKALSVFGEVRCVQPLRQRGGTAAATATQATHGSLTTLEHVLVACTVGLITPNDLLTLCLIVIGVIIIIAIALN